MKRSNFYRILYLLILVQFIPNRGAGQEEIKEDPELTDLIFDYSDKAFYYFRININLDSAEYYYKKAIQLADATGNYSLNDANNYINIASIYREIHFYNEALSNLDKAEDILNRIDPSNSLFGGLYHNKGNIYKEKNDLFKTKEYYEYALDFLIKNGYQGDLDFTFVYSNYIKLLIELGDIKLAEQKLSMINVNDINDEFLVFRIENANATLYTQLDNYDLAKQHFQRAKRILVSHPELKEHPSDLLNYYYNIIGFHMNYKEFDQALTECDKALIFIGSLDPLANRTNINYRADIEYFSAAIHFEEGNMEKSLWIIDKNISELNLFLKNLSTDESHNFNVNKLSTALPELYVLKSRVLFEVYNRSNKFEDLVKSYKAYQEAITTLNLMKLAMSGENSRLFATSQIIDVYYEAIYIGNLLYNLTGEPKYLEQSFEFAETSKSFALYSEIKDVEAMQFSGLPEDIKEKESRYMAEIQYYEEQLYKEQTNSDPDSSRIETFKDNLFHLNADYDDIIREIEQNYAKYYELKYNPKFVSLKEVQEKLAYRDALIEYVLSDSLLITYVVDRKGINVISQEIGPEFEGECYEYYELLHNQNFSSGVHDNYKRYVNLGLKFYKILIEPCLQYTDRKNFTIVPDGAITYIPFEGLITHETETEYINYLDLPYLIKDYSIGYSHSSTLLFSERYKTKSPENKVLAFAPNYKNPLDEADTAEFRQVLDTDDFLFPLIGTIKEVQSINETVPSKVFINENATEANFKKYASDYNVLHLAMHTIMRDDAPLYSMLAFTNVRKEDTIEDNKLYAYEIYNLKLNAQMTVLSACNSGFGKMQKGEGMMSLARGFIYAGCPSIIMTLWQVADKSSSELMTSFYKYLKKGKSKQEAMRMAKVDYLEKADDLTSNPYFWSGFVVLGDSSPIYRKSGFAYWMAVITIFVGLLIYFQYRKSR